MEDLAIILQQLQEDQQQIKAQIREREQILRNKLLQVQRKMPEDLDERQREITQQLIRHEKLRHVLPQRYAQLVREARRRYPNYPERHKQLADELHIAVLKVKEIYQHADSWVATIDTLAIRWQRFGGYYPCPICGDNLTMGWAIIMPQDSPAFEIKDYLFHNLEAGHPTNYQDFWKAITPISLDFYVSGPFSEINMTAEEEVKHHYRHWLTDDELLLTLISLIYNLSFG